jgi:hypothetical protein
MRVVSIRPVEHEVVTPGPAVQMRAAAEPEPAAPAAQTEPPVNAMLGGTAATNADDPPRSVVERIGPAAGDRRLWDRPPEALRASLEPLPNVRARVGKGIAAYNDSVAEAAETARRAADWTKTRAAGDRWGFSPDTIHLGSSRRVLRKCSAGPCQGYLFQPTPGRREEQADRLRVFGETQVQVRRAELERAFQDRVRALRSHNDSIRAVRRGGG